MDLDSGVGAVPGSRATRALILEHVDAFNAHDTERLLAGLHPDIVWATGSDLFRGASELRQLFDDGLWAMGPSLAVRRLLVDGDEAAATLRELLIIEGQPREYEIAAFFTVRDATIRTVKAFREGSADIDP